MDTVRDAGHEVPAYQPARAYALFDRFLRNNYSDTPVDLRIVTDNFDEYGHENNDSSWFWKGFGVGCGIIGGFVLIGLLIYFVIKWRKKRKREHQPLYTETEMNE